MSEDTFIRQALKNLPTERIIDDKQEYTVIRRVREGQDGNEGLSCRVVGRFDSYEKAKQFIEEQHDTNGWVDYVVR